MKQHDFLNNPFMKVMNWAYLILTVSVLFALTNLPLVFCSLFLAVDARNFVFFLIALIPFGPACMAGLSVCDRFVHKQAVHPAKDYAQGLIRYFKRGLAYWLPALVVATILVSDMLFLAGMPQFGRPLLPLLGILLVIALSLVVNVMYVQVRNPDAKMLPVFKLGLAYLIRRWYIAGLNAVLAVAIVVLMVIKPQFGMVITPALLLLLIYLNCEFLGKDRLWQRHQKNA